MAHSFSTKERKKNDKQLSGCICSISHFYLCLGTTEMTSANIADASMGSDSPESLLNDLLGESDAPLLSVLPPATNNRSLSFSRPAGTVQLVGTNGDDILQGTPANSNIFTAGGNDAILTGSGNNFIFATNAQKRGAFERDYLNVASGKNTIFLGDEQGSYYTASGWLDSAYIDGFDVSEDRLVLFGSSDLYTINSNEQGSWLMFGDDNSTAVAYLNGVIDFDLIGSAVVYLEALEETTPAEVSQAEVAIAPEIPSSIFSVQPEIREYDDVGGSVGDDLLVGSDTADRILGFSGRDYAFGGGSADLFVLGDRLQGAYYTQQGWADSVYIDDFTVGVDQLQLSGTASDYDTISDAAGTWILTKGDAIAYLNGVTSVDLNSFSYVTP